jgi:hypothetical protein
VSPEGLVARLGAVEGKDAEEILESSCGLEEWISLEVQDDVAR